MAGAVYALHGEINLDSRYWRSFAVSDRPWFGAAGCLLRGEGLVLCAGPLPCCSTTTTASWSAPGYTDVHIELPILWLLIGLAVVAAAVAWANVRLRTYRLAHRVGRVGVRQLVPVRRTASRHVRTFLRQAERAAAGSTVYPSGTSTSTQEAYNLRQITVKPFPAEQGLTFQSLQDNHATIDNIRLWDWRAVDGHLRAAPGDPHLLPLPRRRHRSLPDRRRLSAGDPRGARDWRPRCCTPTRRPGSTCICCSPTATASSCRR